MSKEIRDQLRGMHAAATNGTWESVLAGDYGIILSADGTIALTYTQNQEANAALIAATHNALPGLLDELDEKDAEIERLSVALRLAQARVAEFGRERDLYKAMYLKTAEGKCEADAKVGALERAIIYLSSDVVGDSIVLCETCVRKDEPVTGLCGKCADKCNKHWQFDQARFEGGE